MTIYAVSNLTASTQNIDKLSIPKNGQKTVSVITPNLLTALAAGKISISPNPYAPLTGYAARVTDAPTLTPDLNFGERYPVAPLTQNLTVAAPLNPSLGSELSFLFEQGGVAGGYTITWNSVFKKSADPSAGTLGKKAVTKFIYDGAHWVQLGGALVWY